MPKRCPKITSRLLQSWHTVCDFIEVVFKVARVYQEVIPRVSKGCLDFAQKCPESLFRCLEVDSSLPLGCSEFDLKLTQGWSIPEVVSRLPRG